MRTLRARAPAPVPAPAPLPLRAQLRTIQGPFVPSAARRAASTLAVAFGYVGKEGVEGADARLDRVCAMLYRYLKPR